MRRVICILFASSSGSSSRLALPFQVTPVSVLKKSPDSRTHTRGRERAERIFGAPFLAAVVAKRNDTLEIAF